MGNKISLLKGEKAMNVLKILSLVLLAVFVLGIIITLNMKGYNSFLVYPFAFLFVYYLLVYVFLVVLSKRETSLLTYFIYIVFILPIIWGILSLTSFFEFLFKFV